MAYRNGNRAIVALLLAAISGLAYGAPVEFPAGSGHFYELFPAPGISWDDARAAAKTKSHNGVHGDLATINSFEEDRFLGQLNNPSGSPKLAWVGGFQAVPCTPEPGCGWKWINNEAIAASNTANPYTNWRQNEPNNTGNASKLAIGDRFTGWVAATTGTWAYIVEYGDTLAPFAINKCAASGPGCNMTRGGAPAEVGGVHVNDGLVLKLPATAIFDGDDEYTVSTWLLQDDPTKCGLEVRSFLNGQLKIPAGLCARIAPYQFVVLKSESNVKVPTGVVEFEADPTKFGLPAWGCTTPILPNVPATDQDTVVWAYSNADDMLDNLFPAGNALLDGNMAEVTSKCSLPKGRGGTGSWFAIGLSFYRDLNAPNALAESQGRMLAQAQRKADLLLIAVNEARKEGAIDKGLHSNLSGQAKNIRNDLTNANFGEATQHVGNFQKAVAAANAAGKIKPEDGNRIKRNWHGEFVFRIDNLADVVNRRLFEE
jgi:hypothetical protein